MHYHSGEISLCLYFLSWPHCLCHALLLLPPFCPAGFVLAACSVWCVYGTGLHQGLDLAVPPPSSTLILLTGPNSPWDNTIPEGSWLKPLFLALRYIKRRQLSSRGQSTLETFFIHSFSSTVCSLYLVSPPPLHLLDSELSWYICQREPSQAKLDQTVSSHYGYCHPAPLVQTCPGLRLPCTTLWPVFWRGHVWLRPLPLHRLHHQPLLQTVAVPQLFGFFQLRHLWGNKTRLRFLHVRKHIMTLWIG